MTERPDELPPCPCGKPWNIDQFDADSRAVVERFVAERGEYVTVSIGEKSWRVPRRCIAYHGITSDQLLNGNGSCFEEVDTTKGGTERR